MFDDIDYLMGEYPTPEQPNSQDSRRRIPLSRQTIRQLEKQTVQQPIVRKQQPTPPQRHPPVQPSSDEKINELMTVIDSYKTAIDEINKRVNALTEQNEYQQEVIEKQQTEIEDLKCLVDILFNEEKPKAEPKAEHKKKPKKTSTNTALIINYIFMVIILIRSFF